VNSVANRLVNRAFLQFSVLCLGLPLVAACSRTSAAPAARGGRGGDGGAAPVVVATVTQKDVPIDVDAIGNVEAFETISVRSQVTGELTDVLFREGDFVHKGDHLFSIDRRPFEAQLEQAQANLTRDQALLAQSKAQLTRDSAQAEYSQLTAERTLQLNQRGIVSKDQADQARAGADATKALVDADKAAVASAQAQLAAQMAAVQNAKVSLDYTTIRSAIDGRTGNLAVKKGNLVNANTTELMTIAQVQPIYVTFAVPSVNLPTIKSHLAEGRLPVVATPQDADARPADGELAFYDNVVDVSTDTIKLKAKFSNSDRRLWPGQFARVRLRLTTLLHAIVVPSQAVQIGQDGQYVFVVKQDSTVEQRPVESRQRVDDDMVIQKGLQLGETVVTEGQLRLENGTRVTTDTTGGGGGGSGRGRGGRGGSGRGGQRSGANGTGQSGQ
jgi:multidrug efflux system membrane fusion protein